MPTLKDCALADILTMSIFRFSNLTHVQNTQKKALGAIIPVFKNKRKSERLFHTVYLKIVHNISSNCISKYLLFGINSELFDSNSRNVFIFLFVSSGLCEL